MEKPPCRHCRQRPASATRSRRGLCWTCSKVAAVRALYPSTSKYACAGVGISNARRLPPESATTARPGSPDKLAELERRAAAELGLWHEDDSDGENGADVVLCESVPEERAENY